MFRERAASLGEIIYDQEGSFFKQNVSEKIINFQLFNGTNFLLRYLS